jgi:folate-dependent phosphoribosylglycinamide formyltransferase PurN
VPSPDVAGAFRIVLFTSASARDVRRLVERIHDEAPEAPEARVAGVLVEQRAGKPLAARVAAFARRLRRADFRRYVMGRAAAAIRSTAASLGLHLVAFVHARRPAPAAAEPSIDDVCRELGCALEITADVHGETALAFVRGLAPDIGIVYGTGILKPSLFSLPRLGSINIHKRKVPEYRGGGPVGLWELLDDQPEIGITVHQVAEAVDEGAVVEEAVIPIGAYDTLTSLSLKAHVVGNDLLVNAVRAFARGEVRMRPQEGVGRTFRSPKPARLADYEREIAGRRPRYRPNRSRSTANLLARSALGVPYVTCRNWLWRARRRFPVVILFHHLVTDRPHRMGIPTEEFLRHVEFLQRTYRVVSLRDAIGMLEADRVTEPTVVLTFDDGYGENAVNLRAVVEQTGVPVTLFISTDDVAGRREFAHDVQQGIAGFPAMTWEQVARMQAAGCEIGSHTRTHFDCGSADRDLLREEIVVSKARLDEQMARPVEYFSFPFGLPENMSSEAMGLAASAYACFCSAFGGYNFPSRGGGRVKHLKRWPHPNSLWELELQMQELLESERALPNELIGLSWDVREEA